METPEISIEEIVKQGTVLGPLLCCGSTEKVNDIGPKKATTISPELDIEALTFVDDILGAGSKECVENTVKSLRKMEVEKKFTFSKEKSKIIKIKKEKQEMEDVQQEIKAGKLETCEQYKYLGNWITSKGTFERQLQMVEEKAKKVGAVMERMGAQTGEMALSVKLFLYEKVGINTVYYDVDLWERFEKS